MEHTMDLSTASVKDLKERCDADDDLACWELFRRAVDDNDDPAWHVVYNKYRLWIISWGHDSHVEKEVLVNDVFMRFVTWTDKKSLAQDFPTIEQVMGGLRRCTRTYIIDEGRAYTRKQMRDEPLLPNTKTTTIREMEDSVFDGITASERQTYFLNRLNDDDEKLIFDLSYKLGLKPKEIFARHPNRFENVKAIHRIKERIVRRFANDPILQKLGQNLQ
jgi:hypothetical protein